MQTANKRKIIYYGIVSLIILLVYYFLNKAFNFTIPCLFHKITGLYCPGCGITRMLFALLRLDIYQAFRYNPWVFLLLMGYIIYKIIELIRGYKFKENKYVVITLLIATLLFGVLRNISTFSFLIPTVIK